MARRAQQEAVAFDVDIDLDIEQHNISPPESPERPSETNGNVPHMNQQQADSRGLSVEEIDDSWIPSPEDQNTFEMLGFAGERDGNGQQQQRPEPPSPHYDGSSTTSWDDEEYENLFLEFISNEDVLPRASQEDENTFMDMSCG
jgi:hypothetical protein